MRGVRGGERIPRKGGGEEGCMERRGKKRGKERVKRMREEGGEGRGGEVEERKGRKEGWMEGEGRYCSSY